MLSEQPDSVGQERDRREIRGRSGSVKNHYLKQNGDLSMTFDIYQLNSFEDDLGGEEELEEYRVR